MRAPLRHWILFVPTIGPSIFSWLLGALSMLVGIAHRPRFVGAAILTLELREWFATGRDDVGPWQYSTTIFRTIWFQPGARDEALDLDDRLEQHERIHIWQIEDLMTLSTIVGAVVGIASGDAELAGYVSQSGCTWQVPNFATALLRFGLAPEIDPRTGKRRSWLKRAFETAYRRSEHEESAYARTDVRPGGLSWWDVRAALWGEEDRDR